MRIGGFDHALHSSPDIELARDPSFDRFGGLDKISEDSIDRIFVKDPQVSVGENVHL